VDVIAHEHVRVKLASRRRKRLTRQVQIAVSIFIVEKTRQAIIATLHDMLRDAGKIQSRKARHAVSLEATRCAAQRWKLSSCIREALAFS
jgi:23S rRNA maturation mini-RNase III